MSTAASSSTIVRFTPLLGCTEDGEEDTFCNLLEIDQTKILLDCGYEFSGGTDYVTRLRELAPQLDAILISHCGLRFVGALPLIINQLKDSCKIIATVPVHFLCRILLIENYLGMCKTGGHSEDQSKCELGYASAPPYDQASIGMVLQRMLPLRYLQTMHVGSESEVVFVNAFPAGGSLGGSMWRIRKSEFDDVLYAVEMSSRKTRLVDAAKFDILDFRPSLLIMDARGITTPNSTPFVNRTGEMIQEVTRFFAKPTRDTCLLIPTDCPTMTLEVAFAFEHHISSLSRTKPSFTCNVLMSQTTQLLEVAKGLLEWFSLDITEEFDNRRSHPLDMTHVRFVTSLEEVKLPGVVICGPELLTGTGGISAEVLSRWGEGNLRVLLTRGQEEDVFKLEFEICEWNALSEVEKARLNRLRADQKARKEAEARIKERLEEESDGDQVDVEDEDENIVERRNDQQLADTALMQRVYWATFVTDMQVSLPAGISQGRSIKCDTPMLLDMTFNALARDDHHQQKFGSPYGDVHFDFKKPSLEPLVDDQLEERNRKEIQVNLVDAFAEMRATVKRFNLSKLDQRSLNLRPGLDLASALYFVNRLNPRKTLLLGGDLVTRRYARNSILLDEVCPEVIIGKNDELVNMSIEQNLLRAELQAGTQEIVFTEVGCGYHGAMIHFKISHNEEENKKILEVEKPAGRLKQVVRIGDPKLSDIRKSLQSENVKSKLDAGVLHLGSHVSLTKKDQFEMRGKISDDFFELRRHIEAQVAELFLE